MPDRDGDRDDRLCGPGGNHRVGEPGPDGVARCPCGRVSRHPAPGRKP